MKISKLKDHPDYKRFADCCVVYLDDTELEPGQWDTANEEDGVVELDGESHKGNVVIFRPYGCEPERGI